MGETQAQKEKTKAEQVASIQTPTNMNIVHAWLALYHLQPMPLGLPDKQTSATAESATREPTQGNKTASLAPNSSTTWNSEPGYFP